VTNRLTLLLAALSVAGCASIEPPAAGRGHPANPQAAQAPPPAASTTLAIDEDDLPAAPSRMPQAQIPQDGSHGGAQPASGPAPHAAPHNRPAASRPSDPAAAVLYVCPMHPEVQSPAPGTCPKCGMDLVRKEAGGNE
jgi:hypothetical protein